MAAGAGRADRLLKVLRQTAEAQRGTWGCYKCDPQTGRRYGLRLGTETMARRAGWERAGGRYAR